jgi:hypothetical protein
MLDDRELTLRRTIGVTETLLPQVTSSARCLRCFESRDAIAIEEHVLTSAVELLPCGTDAACVCFVVEKVPHGE